MIQMDKGHKIFIGLGSLITQYSSTVYVRIAMGGPALCS